MGKHSKISKAELWLLCMTRRLNVLYKCIKFRRNLSYSFQVIERKQFCDTQTDRRKGKTILLHLTYITMRYNSTYGYNVLDKHYHITSLWYLRVPKGNQMHPFDRGTLTWGRWILHPKTLHNKMALCPTSVSPSRFFLSCGILGIICNNLPDVDTQLNTWLDLRQDQVKNRKANTESVNK